MHVGQLVQARDLGREVGGAMSDHGFGERHELRLDPLSLPRDVGIGHAGIVARIEHGAVGQRDPQIGQRVPAAREESISTLSRSATTRGSAATASE